MLEISCVFPALNEADCIDATLRQADAALRELGADFELIVVDDGSTDATAQIARRFADEHPHVHVLKLRANEGYGMALRAGFRVATKPWVFFTDADGQFDLHDLAAFDLSGERVDLMVGYRAPRHEGSLRRLYSTGYNALCREVLGVSVRDVNCAFKLIRRSWLSEQSLTSSGYEINVELLVLASRQARRIAEAPVRHLPRAGGETKTSVADIPRYLWRLYRMRQRLLG